MLSSYCILQIYMECLCENRVCTSTKTQCSSLQVSPSEHAELQTSPLPCLSALHSAFPSCLCCQELPNQDPSLTKLMWPLPYSNMIQREDEAVPTDCPGQLLHGSSKANSAPHWCCSFPQELYSVLDSAHTSSVLPKVLISLEGRGEQAIYSHWHIFLINYHQTSNQSLRL